MGLNRGKKSIMNQSVIFSTFGNYFLYCPKIFLNLQKGSAQKVWHSRILTEKITKQST